VPLPFLTKVNDTSDKKFFNHKKLKLSTISKGLFGRLTIFLDIEQRTVYKRVKSSCKESFLGRERNPQRTPNSFFGGFFIQPRRGSYQARI
jgi:hypothetical protein